LKIAKTIASKSPVAINISKKSIIYSRDHSVEEGLNHIALLNGVML
jgi:delta(3,5)-delta(2,4)-dienoyl-CoA isomerase